MGAKSFKPTNADAVFPDEGEHPGEAAEGWPTAGDIERDNGISKRTVGRLASKLRIKRYLCRGEIFRFDPKDVLAILNEWQSEDDDKTASVEQTAVNTEATKVTFEGSAEMVKSAHQHALQSWAAVHEPGRVLLEMMRTENERLRARIEFLESRYDEVLKARETMISEQHARELASVIVTKAEERKGKAFELFSQNVPRIVQQLGIGDRRTELALKLLQSLTPMQLELLGHTELEVLTPEQKDILQQIGGLTQTAQPSAAKSNGAAS